ncbi:hypothetical protein, partial [Providencia alcalifaciens]|uniref:hypothetical protein n=1 Tax=Providencia alcalifaciens TaxID=126385 RepID=UPI003D275084
EKPPIGWLFCVWEKGKSPQIGLCGPCYKKSAIYGVRRNANGRKFAYFSAASHHPLERSPSPISHHNHDALFSVTLQRNLEYGACAERGDEKC